MRVFSSITLLTLLLAGPLVSVSRADVLVLSNGDRLTGDVIRQEDGELVFQSRLLGEVRVPADQATIVTTSEPATSLSDTAAAKVVSADSSGATQAAHGRPAAELTRADGRGSSIESRESSWKRQIELGLSSQEGLRDQKNLSVRLEADRISESGSMRLELSHHYGKTDGVLISDATSANATLTRNLNKDLFLRGATRFDRDPVVGLDHDAEQSLGLGFTLLKNENMNVSVGGGGGVRNRDLSGGEAEWDALFDAFGRLKCAFTDRLSLSQDLTVSAAPDDATDYRLKSHTAFVNQLTEMLRMTVRYEFEYHGSALTDVPTRQRLVTAIGCVF